MKLRDMTNEQALDTLADLIDPVSEIASDKEILEILRDKGRKKSDAVKRLLRDHKASVITILALLDGKDPAEYRMNMLTLPLKVLEILNDPEMLQLFTFQPPRTEPESSGAVSADARGLE